jgi:voltage-gated sodium channel
MTDMSVANAAALYDDGTSGWSRKIVNAPWFARFILIAIGLTGILAGVETYPLFRGASPLALAVEWAQYAILCIFVAEMALKITVYGVRPWRYFKNGWNIFDFSIVAASLLPVGVEYLVVLRLVRVLRLFTALRGLQILLTALLRGIPSLGYVGLLLLLHFYIYSVIGTFAFGSNDPVRFGSLHSSMLTLFQVLTLEGWNDILATEYLGSDVGYDDAWKQVPEASDRLSIAHPLIAPAYFVSFILIGTMIVLNLVTGVIITSLEEANAAAEETRKHRSPVKEPPAPRDEVQQISEQLQALAARLSAVDANRRQHIEASSGRHQTDPSERP